MGAKIVLLPGTQISKVGTRNLKLVHKKSVVENHLPHFSIKLFLLTCLTPWRHYAIHS
jgi:hypothetical protein